MRVITYFVLVIGLLVSTTNPLKAQYAFRVMATMGKSLSNAQILKAGNQLKHKDKVSVQPKSYLSLIHRSGGTVQISSERSAIERNIDNLEENLKKNRYQTYLVSDVQQSSRNHKYMSAYGAVERSQEAIEVVLPRQARITQSSFTLQWNAATPQGEYLIQILNFENQLIKTYTTSQNQYTLQLNEFITQIPQGQSFIVRIASKNNPAVRTNVGFALKPLSVQEKSNLQTQLNHLKSTELTGTGNAYDTFVLADFYESKQLFFEAKQAYEALLALPNLSEDDREAFQIAYFNFLQRNNIVVSVIPK